MSKLKPVLYGPQSKSVSPDPFQMTHHPIQVTNHMQTVNIYQQPQPGMTQTMGFGSIPKKIIMKKNRKRINSNNTNYLDQKYVEIQQIINKSQH
jgi:hypothetical protein